MSAALRERYVPLVIPVNTTVPFGSNALGGFLCSVTGTITLVANAADGKIQTTLLSAYPVTAGVYYPLPFYIGKAGGTFTTADGAAGLLGT